MEVEHRKWQEVTGSSRQQYCPCYMLLLPVKKKKSKGKRYLLGDGSYQRAREIRQIKWPVMTRSKNSLLVPNSWED